MAESTPEPSQNIPPQKSWWVRWRNAVWAGLVFLAFLAGGPVRKAIDDIGGKILIQKFEAWLGDKKTPKASDIITGTISVPAASEEWTKCSRDRTAAQRQQKKKIEAAGAELETCRTNYKQSHKIFGKDADMNTLCDGWTRNIAALQTESRSIETWCADIKR